MESFNPAMLRLLQRHPNFSIFTPEKDAQDNETDVEIDGRTINYYNTHSTNMQINWTLDGTIRVTNLEGQEAYDTRWNHLTKTQPHVFYTSPSSFKMFDLPLTSRSITVYEPSLIWNTMLDGIPEEGESNESHFFYFRLETDTGEVLFNPLSIRVTTENLEAQAVFVPGDFVPTQDRTLRLWFKASRSEEVWIWHIDPMSTWDLRDGVYYHVDEITGARISVAAGVDEGRELSIDLPMTKTTYAYILSAFQRDVYAKTQTLVDTMAGIGPLEFYQEYARFIDYMLGAMFRVNNNTFRTVPYVPGQYAKFDKGFFWRKDSTMPWQPFVDAATIVLPPMALTTRLTTIIVREIEQIENKPLRDRTREEIQRLQTLLDHHKNTIGFIASKIGECLHCGKKDPKHLCGQCDAPYCDQNCAEANYKTHKRVCK